MPCTILVCVVQTDVMHTNTMSKGQCQIQDTYTQAHVYTDTRTHTRYRHVQFTHMWCTQTHIRALQLETYTHTVGKHVFFALMEAPSSSGDCLLFEADVFSVGLPSLGGRQKPCHVAC